ncbi:glycosyltransferase family 39 protein [Williamsia serinedens]|uniref:4-amino-4-deoxy-L-arabinose transferase n=1 Tax=Williamsia serinedens TaxID=391736 RepID=A0ABT1H0I5_9NOCA|nr:glycosyltransferase family 39 protein [Williamsia serinedens]MCP2160757.1 4-amino-4-deoxy-L-arabinose transferase [Williamsia serinedens]
MTAVLDRPTRRTDPAPEDPSRAHALGLALLLVGTGVLYLWDLSINRYANDFYTAAIQAGSQSWKAWFFGSSDAANSITVDKPPLSLWIPGLAVRLFGLNSWAVLVPQALMGVATVAIVYAIGRRLAGPSAGLLAGLVMAVTPVMVVVSRFDNPDALLVLLLTAAAWATVRILDDGRLRWAVLAGGLLGLAFLTKQLQALVVVPAMAIAFLVFAAAPVRRRILTLVAALGALVVGAGWWVLAVEVWPASSRPYIGGTQHNSIIELTVGYNGLGRVTGDESSGIGGAPGGGAGHFSAMFGGHTGPLRMFSPAVGGQVAWLIPAALILGVLAIVLRGRASRTGPERASLVFAGLWLVTTAALLSSMAGIFHPYYTLAFAPPIAILVGVGSIRGWQARRRPWVRATLIATVVVTAVVAVVFLRRTPQFAGWLSWAIVIAAALAVLAVLVDVLRPTRLVAVAGLSTVLVVALAGPVAYSLDTVATPRVGGLVSAGPRVGSGFGFDPTEGRTGTARSQAFPIPGGQAALQAARRAFTGEAPPRAVVDLLGQDAGRHRWVAASVSSLSAAGYQLATGRPVMPVGGFAGSDPSPTLAQFQADVAAGRIHWFIGGFAGFGGRAADRPSTQITQWVTTHFTPRTVDGVTLYDLTGRR